MVRGIFREILSIANWFCSIAATYYLYQPLLSYTSKYIVNKQISVIVTGVAIFLTTLIITSLITANIADIIINSRIGFLDRTLGFLFGGVRGLLLLTVIAAFWNLMVDVNKQPIWISHSKSKPFLDAMIVKLKSVLPNQFTGLLEATSSQKPTNNIQHQHVEEPPLEP